MSKNGESKHTVWVLIMLLALLLIQIQCARGILACFDNLPKRTRASLFPF
jgi:hypothetical protein